MPVWYKILKCQPVGKVPLTESAQKNVKQIVIQLIFKQLCRCKGVRKKYWNFLAKTLVSTEKYG